MTRTTTGITTGITTGTFTGRIAAATLAAGLALAAAGSPALAGSLGSILRDAQSLATGGLGTAIGSAIGTATGTTAAPAGETDGAGPRTAVTAPQGRPEAPDPDAHHLTWDTKFTATRIVGRDMVGQRFRFYCPPAPSTLVPRAVFGTDVYRFETVVCRAAVHAGRIGMMGGNVTVRLGKGVGALHGSTRNGITTKSGPSGDRTITFE